MSKDGKEIDNLQHLPKEVRLLFARHGMGEKQWKELDPKMRENIVKTVDRKTIYRPSSKRPDKIPPAPPSNR